MIFQEFLTKTEVKKMIAENNKYLVKKMDNIRGRLDLLERDKKKVKGYRELTIQELKKVDDMIDCEIEELKLKRDENGEK